MTFLPSAASEAPMRVAFYLRLSKEDSASCESNSISNQRLILRRFLESHPELSFFREYVDDGQSGTNFNRPGFSQMMDDLDHRLFDCILCKDCARFGRDYVGCGFYIRSFDEAGIRFIAVNDQYDSFDPHRDDTIFAIKNVINAEYSRSKSKELKKLFKEKQYCGQYMGAFAVYGYQKDPSDKHHFLIDPCAAAVVRRIFSLFCIGMKKQSIARLLTEEGIPSPEEYKRAVGSHFDSGHRVKKTGWSYASVHTVLNNPVYLGHTVQNKTYRKSMRGKASRHSPEDWIIVEHTHDPIISPDIWEKTQRLLHLRSGNRPNPSSVSLLSGFLKCAECGASLSSARWGKQPVFLCGTYKRLGKSHCSPHLVPKQLLYDLILEDVNSFLGSCPDLTEILSSLCADQTSEEKDVGSSLKNIELQSAKISGYKQKAFELYSDHRLSLDDFCALQQQYALEEQKLAHFREALAHTACENDTLSAWTKAFVQSRRLPSLDRAILADIIAQIQISESKEITIVYRF